MKPTPLTLVLAIFIFSVAFAPPGAAGGEVQVLRVLEGRVGDCISPEQREQVRSLRLGSPGVSSPLVQPILFEDPMDRGMNALGRTVILYVDHDPGVGTSAFTDFTCRAAAYDGHLGTDIVIQDFVDMDEGVPVLAAHAGMVSFTQDGEFDRHLKWVNNSIGNAVILDHGSNVETCYWHMKKGSVRVQVGEQVAAGDTLGMVGSSGRSAFPHLHFEVTESGINRDPFQGACQIDPSRWVGQGEHVLDLPFMLQDHGLMTVAATKSNAVERVPTKTHVTAGSEITSWAMLRSMQAGDVVRFEFQFEDSTWYTNTDNVVASEPLAWWIATQTLPDDPSVFGEWAVHITRNDSTLADQVFTYDDTPNQAALVDAASYMLPENTSLTGEFTGSDPDGSIFRFRSDLGWPVHGKLEQFGGRGRKFLYTPNSGFVGLDSIRVQADDDEFLAGPFTWIHFQVGDPVPVARVSGLHAVSSPDGIEVAWWSADVDRGVVILVERRSPIDTDYREIHRMPLTEGPNHHLDTGVAAGETYSYRLIVIDRTGGHTVFGPITVTAGATPARFALSPGHPNPFSSTIRMQYTLPAPEAVTFTVFDARGRRIRAMDLGNRDAGTHSVAWDGRDDRGLRARVGVYFLRLSGGGEARTQKVMLVTGG